MARRSSGGGGGGGGGGASEAAVYAATVADWERHQAALCQRCIFPGCPNPPDRGQRKDGAGRRRACCPAHAKRYQTMPPREIPLAMLPAYSMGGRVKIVYDHAKYSWRNESGLNAGLHWSKAYMDEYAKQYSPDRIRRSRRGPSPGVRPWWTDEQYRPTYGGLEAYDVFMALDRHGVKGGKRVAVVGSQRPVSKNLASHARSRPVCRAWAQCWSDVSECIACLLARALQWIEAMLIALGNRVSTIEYNVPTTDHPMLECKSYADWFEPGDSNGNTSHGR
jgi:hypothetical protein